MLSDFATSRSLGQRFFARDTQAYACKATDDQGPALEFQTHI